MVALGMRHLAPTLGIAFDHRPTRCHRGRERERESVCVCPAARREDCRARDVPRASARITSHARGWPGTPPAPRMVRYGLAKSSRKGTRREPHPVAEAVLSAELTAALAGARGSCELGQRATKTRSGPRRTLEAIA